jgi:hypothetical protein
MPACPAVVLLVRGRAGLETRRAPAWHATEMRRVFAIKSESQKGGCHGKGRSEIAARGRSYALAK